MRASLRALLLVALLAAPALAGCVGSPEPAARGPLSLDACDFHANGVQAPDGPRAARSGPATATLLTDAHGVSHVYADDAYSLHYAFGYVHARDRLFQMDLLRHVARGDSASVVGEAQLASDMQVRRDLYSREELATMYTEAPPWGREILAAYADGVNRRIVEAAATGDLPAEFAVLGHAPEPWQPTDSVAILAYMLGVFGSGGGNEIGNARILGALEGSLGDAEAAWRAFGDVAGARWGSTPSIAARDAAPTPCQRLLARSEVPPRQLELAAAAARATAFGVPQDVADLLDPARPRGGLGLTENLRFGSNALLVAAEHSSTGAPLMFGGPQMGYFKPSIVHEVGLHGAGWDVVGIAVPGAPGVVIGRTPTFAWTVTSGFDDQVDTVALELDPADPRRYRWGDAYEGMTCRGEIHRVAANAASASPPRVVTQEVCRARGMPVVAVSAEDGVAFAQRTTSRGLEAAGALAWALLGRASTRDEFRETLATMPFTFNYHYAGPEGIALYHVGALPLRSPGLDARLPALAGDEHAWRGVVHGLALGTWVEDPSSGYVVNWNNPPTAGWASGDTPYALQGLHRVDLLDGLVRDVLRTRGGGVTLDDVAGVLRDAATRDPFAPHLATLLAQAARRSGEPSLMPLAHALEEWGRAEYAWRDDDGDGRYDDVGHAVWDEARLALQARLLASLLGDATPVVVYEPGSSNARAHGGFTQDGLLLHALSKRTAHDWCGGGCDGVLVAALREARAALATRFGTEDSARWLEDVHMHATTPMGAARPDAFPMVNRGTFNFLVAIGEGVEGAWSVLPPGNSGHLPAATFLAGFVLAGDEPPHFRDQLDLYASFRYKPMPVTAAEVESAAVRADVLVVP